MAHISIVLLWISGMLFHGSYFSNYLEWLSDPSHVKPSAHFVWSLVGQDILNSDVGGYTQGIYITSGIFHIWRSQGMVSLFHLKAASLVSFIACIGALAMSFYVMHLGPINTGSNIGTYKNVVLMLGLSSISWSAHILHIAAPINRLLDTGVEPSIIMPPHSLLSRDVIRGIFQGFGQTPFHPISFHSSTTMLVNGYVDASGSIPLSVSAAHHLYLGIALILSGLLIRTRSRASSAFFEAGSLLLSSWHCQLSLSLLMFASMSFIYAHNVYSVPVYPYLACDYATVVCLYCHHMWIGGLFMIGFGAHSSIALISDIKLSQTPSLITQIISHRDSIIGHLIWVVLFLGFHSFGLYIHNDTLQALGRTEDSFSDSSIILKPIFSTLAGLNVVSSSVATDSQFQVIGSKISYVRQSLGSCDFMIHHIHAFTIHTTSLILVKGSLFSRSSRLVSDKVVLGFRYPCDGPGRGGTCQISPWDHIFLAVFWMYNSVSILIFHFFWKMQSDVWGSLTQDGRTFNISHLTSGDFASNSNSINGWLRSFLWSQSSQVIQSYSTSLAAYSLVFLGAHLIWAFSLMFLFSGRGYWQELIESILWSHSKLKFTPYIQPRALSISQGRSVGLSHYVLGGIGCTWSFFIARIVSIS